MTDRLVELQGAMADRGVDLIVVGPTANLRYLLDYEAIAIERITVLLVSREDAVMILPDFDAAEFVETTGFAEVLPWNDKRGPASAIESAFARLGGVRTNGAVAVDDELPYAFFLLLRDGLGAGPPRLASDVIAPLRLVKAPEEQERIARTAALVSQGIDVALKNARPGIAERQLAGVVEAAMREGGAESVDFVLVASGPASASPHHQAGARELRAGEPVLVDIALRLDGYYADITQQAFLGTPPDDYRHAYEAVLAAEEAGVQEARAGATASQVDAAATKVLVEAGLGEWSGPRTGHGIGIDVHEPPSVVEGNESELPAGAVITVEPGIYIPGRYGIRIEDTVLVTSGEPCRMTRGARPLATVDV